MRSLLTRPPGGFSKVLAILALTVAGCAGPGGASIPATAPAPSSPAPPTSIVAPTGAATAPVLTAAPPAHVEALAWADILDMPQDAGTFTVQLGDKSTSLDVSIGHVAVGRVFSRAYSDIEITVMGNPATPAGLRSLAQRYVDQLRAQRTSERPSKRD